MEPEFWHNAWESGKTGWRQNRVNTRLEKFWPALAMPQVAPDTPTENPGSAQSHRRVFVPLCGDSPDVKWLLDQGHPVVGCELSESAVLRFFTDYGIDYQKSEEKDFSVYRGDNIVFYCGDFFLLTPERLQGVTMVYDRAATVALPEDLRFKYVQQMGNLTEAGTDVLLITFAYDQSKMDGPPFSVSDHEVESNFGGLFQIKRLGGASGPEILGNLKERGLDTVAETIFHLRRN